MPFHAPEDALLLQKIKSGVFTMHKVRRQLSFAKKKKKKNKKNNKKNTTKKKKNTPKKTTKATRCSQFFNKGFLAKHQRLAARNAGRRPKEKANTSRSHETPLVYRKRPRHSSSEKVSSFLFLFRLLVLTRSGLKGKEFHRKVAFTDKRGRLRKKRHR